MSSLSHRNCGLEKLTPKEGPGLARRPLLQVHADRSDGINRGCTGSVAGKHHIKVREMALTQTLIEITNLLRTGSRSAELSIPSVIAYDCVNQDPTCLGRTVLHYGRYTLKWTVFKAATSQPKACMTHVAMVFPTYLATGADDQLQQRLVAACIGCKVVHVPIYDL